MLRPEPAAEVPGEGVDDVVVRLHFCQIGTIPELFEAQESFHAVELPARFFGNGYNIAHCGVGKVAIDLVAMSENQ